MSDTPRILDETAAKAFVPTVDQLRGWLEMEIERRELLLFCARREGGPVLQWAMMELACVRSLLERLG